MTKAEKLYEIGRCISDPIYAIEHYLETEDRTQNGYVPFKLFPKQKELVNGYGQFHHNIVMKPRQAGISTTTAAYAAIITALASKSNPERILIAANKQETAKEFLKKIKEFTMQLPAWMDVYRPIGSETWFDKEKNSNSHYKLHNGSEIKAVASSKDALRGYTPSLIIIDEAAFIEGNRGEEFYSAAQPSLSTGGKSILISCVTKDTFVFTKDGIQEVGDFIDEEENGGYIIKDYDIYGLNKFRSSNIMFNNGYVDTKIIKTKLTTLEGSLNHKVFAYSSEESKYDWYKLEDLKIGDYISVNYGLDIWGNHDDCSDFNPEENTRNRNKFKPSKITEDISYFLGLFLAEGSTFKKIKNDNHNGTSITISCGDDISETFNKIGLKYSFDGKFHYTVSSKELGEFLEYLGFDLSKKAKEKIIPSRLLKMSKPNIISFLRGFMDGDGYSRADNGKVGVTSSSKRLVEQLRILFLNLGILSEYQEKLTKPTKRVKVESMGHRLHFNSINSKKYYDIIGFNIQRKEIKKNSLKEVRLNNTYDVIPNGGDIIKSVYEKYKKNRPLKFYKEKGVKIGHVIKKNIITNRISRNMVLSVLKLNNEEIDYIKDNIYWCEIKSIDDSKNHTYDFSLPNDENDFWCHSIIYNGIVGHQTPNGKDPLYYKTYTMALEGENNFNVVQMKWYEDPRYNKGLKWLMKSTVDGEEKIEEKLEDDKTKWGELIDIGWLPTSAWYENMCAQLNHNQRQIAQELNCDFLGSGDNVIDDKYIQYHRKNNMRDPVRKEWIDGNMWIWEDPIEDHEYIMALDAAGGSSDDFSVICIWDYTTGNQVAEYRGKTPPDTLGEIGKYYGDSYSAFCVVDITGGYGISSVLKMIELGYPTKRMFYDTPIGINALENNKALEKYMNNGKLPGLNFQKNRGTIVSKLEECIRLDNFKVRSIRAINEMSTFVYINGRPDHQKGYHDDILMSIAMCYYVGMTSFKDLEKSKGQAKAMISSWVVESTETNSNNVLNIDNYILVDGNSMRKNQVSAQQAKEYNWLFGGMPGFNKNKR